MGDEMGGRKSSKEHVSLNRLMLSQLNIWLNDSGR